MRRREAGSRRDRVLRRPRPARARPAHRARRLAAPAPLARGSPAGASASCTARAPTSSSAPGSRPSWRSAAPAFRSASAPTVPPCNNRLDAWAELRLAAQLASVRSGPGSLSGLEALRLATSEGARVLGPRGRDRLARSRQAGRPGGPARRPARARGRAGGRPARSGRLRRLPRRRPPRGGRRRAAGRGWAAHPVGSRRGSLGRPDGDGDAPGAGRDLLIPE